MKISNLGQISLENQYALQEHLQDISYLTLQYLNKRLIYYKKANGMFEFVDMISEFIRKKKCPQFDAVFLDEAQDLSFLQWQLVFELQKQHTHQLQKDLQAH